MRRYIKSLNKVYALEIDHLGVHNNISKHTFLSWNEISYCRMKQYKCQVEDILKLWFMPMIHHVL
jgi:hypothetical protein